MYSSHLRAVVGSEGHPLSLLIYACPSPLTKNVHMRIGSWLSGKELAAKVTGPEFRFAIKARHNTLCVV